MAVFIFGDCIICSDMVILHSLVLYGLCFPPIYGIYFGPLGAGY